MQNDKKPMRRYQASWHFGAGVMLLLLSECWREWFPPVTSMMRFLRVGLLIGSLALLGWSYDEESN